MSKSFFEITNATFKVGGINKVNNVSLKEMVRGRKEKPIR